MKDFHDPFVVVAAVRDFRELKVWARAHQLTVALYKATRTFPAHELYGLTSQIRRSACSVCANIAEGCGRRSRKELVQFLSVASGSASELEYHLVLAADLGFIDSATHTQLADALTHVRRMLAGFIRTVTANS